MSSQRAQDKTEDKNDIDLYLTEYEDGENEEPTQQPGVTWWALGYSISLTCDSNAAAQALFDALQHVVDIEAD